MNQIQSLRCSPQGQKEFGWPSVVDIGQQLCKAHNFRDPNSKLKAGVGSSELEEISHWVGSSHMPTSTLPKSYTFHSV